MRATAMAAGMRHEALLIAVVALRQHDRAQRGAAVLHRRQRSALTGKQSMLVIGQKLGFEGLDDRGQQDHLTVLQSMAKPFIKALIASPAF
jgi:hypothetical protein